MTLNRSSIYRIAFFFVLSVVLVWAMNGLVSALVYGVIALISAGAYALYLRSRSANE